MFDFAWSEFALIGLVAVLVLGPKELPKAMRSLAQFMRKARKLAGEFQGHWNEMVREAELGEVKQAVQSISSKKIGAEVEKLIDPSGEFKRELNDTVTSAKRELETAAKSADDAIGEAKAAAGSTPGAEASTPSGAKKSDDLKSGGAAAPPPAVSPAAE